MNQISWIVRTTRAAAIAGPGEIHIETVRRPNQLPVRCAFNCRVAVFAHPTSQYGPAQSGCDIPPTPAVSATKVGALWMLGDDVAGLAVGDRVAALSYHSYTEYDELAKATVPLRSSIPWDEWVADYGKIRDAIAATCPDIFHDFNARLFQPGGFHRPLGARKRKWKTETGNASFIVPTSLATDIDVPPEQRDVVQLITLRSNGQLIRRCTTMTTAFAESTARAS